MIQGSLEEIIQNSSFFRSIKIRKMTWRFAMKEFALMLSKTNTGISTISAWEEDVYKTVWLHLPPLFNKVYRFFLFMPCSGLLDIWTWWMDANTTFFHVTFYVNFSIITKPSKFTLIYWNRDWRGKFLDSVYNIGIGAWQAGDFGEGF